MRYLFLDLETTGLERDASILEIAAILVDDDLEELSRFHRVVSGNLSKLTSETQNMHARNYLLLAVGASGVLWEEADRQCEAWLRASTVARPDQGLTLAGSSIWADRTWLQHHGSAIFEQLTTHRMLDISAVSIFLKSVGVDVEECRSSTHRAMNDIEATLETARRQRRAIVNAASSRDLDLALASCY